MKQRTIIAMKGGPFTRKTEIATLFATSLRCPLLSLEDVLDVMDPDEVQISTCPNTNSPAEDLAFKIICQIANSNLTKGVCDKIVIDSPLLSRLHFDQLIKLVESLKKTRLVIVECKLKNRYSWQMKFEDYVQQNHHKIKSKWYKAKTWDDVNKALIQDEYESRVSKLILDPIWDHLKLETKPYSSRILKSLHQKVLISDQPPPLMEAIEYMITHKEGVDDDVVVYYSEWRNSNRRHCEISGREKTKIAKKQGSYCRDGHTITKYTELGFDESEMVNCMACGKEVKGSAYPCNFCSLALHKECAESFKNGRESVSHRKEDKKRYEKIKRSKFLISPQYWFPQMFACASCKENRKTFSVYCMSCLFETNLKGHLMPTIIKHSCHEKHFFSIVFFPENYCYPEAYKCSGCGELVAKVFYSCKICSIYYHVKCLTRIRMRVYDEHGGHHHLMQLKFSCKEAEDYHCDECLERRDPQLWFYSCQDCVFQVHLECIFQKSKKVGPKYWGTPGFITEDNKPAYLT